MGSIRKKIFTTFVILMFVLSIMAIGNAQTLLPLPEDYCVTAAKAYDMMQEGATLLDCRTLEEYCWVGNPADGDGNPIAYNIPYKLWTSRIDCETGNPVLITAERLFGWLIRRTFPYKDTPLILMCRSGGRSTAALEFLYSLGYREVYEIDNYLKEEASPPGGRGGFQGSSSNSPAEYAGYRGWPGRVDYLDLYPTYDPDWIPTDEEQSVSWMDTGLPMTQKLDCSLILMYRWRRQ